LFYFCYYYYYYYYRDHYCDYYYDFYSHSSYTVSLHTELAEVLEVLFRHGEIASNCHSNDDDDDGDDDAVSRQQRC
jgi:hypothetical protein